MNPKDPIYEAYTKSNEPIDESTLAIQDYVTVNKSELDERSVIYLTNAVRGVFDLIQNMKNLKRVLRNNHYNGLKAALWSDIKKGL